MIERSKNGNVSIADRRNASKKDVNMRDCSLSSVKMNEYKPKSDHS